MLASTDIVAFFRDRTGQTLFACRLPSPMLRLLPDLRALKQKAHEAYCRRYGLPVILPPIVKHADLVLLATEKRDVMLPAPAEWMKMPDPLVGKIRAWPNPYARFVKRWRELAREVDYKGVA